VSESTTSEADRPDLPESDLPDDGGDAAAQEESAQEEYADGPTPEEGATEVPASPSATTVDDPEELEAPAEPRDGTSAAGAEAEIASAGDGPSSSEGSADEQVGDEELGDGQAGDDGARDDLDRLENEGDIAADYLEELLDIADLDGDLDMDVEGDRAAVSIVGGDVRLLVGRDGEVLEALQELTRLAVYRETGERSRLMLDVGGFRADKRSRLERVAADAVAEVKASGERKALDPMTPFERKVVHDAVAAAGLSSESEGVEPRRHVVVLPG
jgi:spoIIIJ-associated protein